MDAVVLANAPVIAGAVALVVLLFVLALFSS